MEYYESDDAEETRQRSRRKGKYLAALAIAFHFIPGVIVKLFIPDPAAPSSPVSDPSSPLALLFWALFVFWIVLVVVLYAAACASIAVGKGRGARWGCMGLLSMIGLIVVALLPRGKEGAPSALGKFAKSGGIEPWERFRQFVRVAAHLPDSHVLTNMRFQFMFRDRAEARHVLASLPKKCRAALAGGTLWYDNVAAEDRRNAEGWVQMGWDGVRLSIRDGKDLMNHVVTAGGEIYEAFLTE